MSAEKAIEESGTKTVNANLPGHDPFAEYRAPQFDAPQPGQASKFVEWQMDLGKCSSLLHSMWLLGDAATSSDKSNDNIYVAPTALSRMSQADINRCAESLPPGYYAKKDSNGDVNYLGYQRSTPDFPNPIEHPFVTIFGGPAIALIKGYEMTKHLFTDEASVKVKDGYALYSVPFWYDLKDGYSKVKVKLAE